MAGIQTRKFNWVSTPSGWEQMQLWREKQKQSAARQESLAAASAGLSGAAQNFISESGALAVQAAIKRNQDAAKAKAAAAAKAESKAKLDALL